MTRKSIPVYAWISTSAFSALRLFGPKELGGFGDIKPQASIQAKETGEDEDDILKEVSKTCLLAALQVLNACASYIALEAEAWSLRLECLKCTTMNGTLRRYDAPTLVIMPDKYLLYQDTSPIPLHKIFIASYMYVSFGRGRTTHVN